MKPSLSRVADISVIVMCLIAAGSAIDRSLQTRAVPRSSDAAYSKGERLPVVAAVDLSGSRKTLLMFLSTHCKYCNQSADFYATLAARRETLHVKLVAVSVEPAEDIAAYLSRRSIAVDSIVQVQQGTYRVHGTPTLLLTDHSARVLNSWKGLLHGREPDVIAAISE